MSRRRGSASQFDLFVPMVNDLRLKDQQEVMARPFFSLQKRKRIKPIEYVSESGSVTVRVSADPLYGMATIWDADILIYAASVLNELKNKGANYIPRTLHTNAHDLLRAIRRPINSKAYKELEAALERLKTTSIRTSIRTPKRPNEEHVGWLDYWKMEVDKRGVASGLTITLSDWVYNGILEDGGLLTISPAYFDLTGAIERVLYRFARKHVGMQRYWLCRVSVLHSKSGSDSKAKEFSRKMRDIVARDALPDYTMCFAKTVDGEDAVRFLPRGIQELERQERLEQERLHAMRVDAHMDELSGVGSTLDTPNELSVDNSPNGLRYQTLRT